MRLVLLLLPLLPSILCKFPSTTFNRGRDRGIIDNDLFSHRNRHRLDHTRVLEEDNLLYYITKIRGGSTTPEHQSIISKTLSKSTSPTLIVGASAVSLNDNVDVTSSSSPTSSPSTPSPTPSGQLNQVRATFLFFYTCLGSLLPYLPVYYHSLGLSGPWIGVLGAVNPMTTFIVGPIWGGIADKYNKVRGLGWGCRSDSKCIIPSINITNNLTLVASLPTFFAPLHSTRRSS